MSSNIIVSPENELATTLMRLANEKGIVEIVTRDVNKKYKEFVKVFITDSQTEQKELAEEALRKIGNKIEKGFRDIQLDLAPLASSARILSGIGYANLALSAASLCATCAGFVIIYQEIERVSEQIDQHLARIDETMRKNFDINRKSQFDKVLSDHNDMLDSIKRQQPYGEKEMRELVDSEYRLIMMLANTLKADVSNDQWSLIVLLFTLMGMFTASLCKFDELYYYNNPQIHEHENPWHTSHENWMNVYNVMSSDWLIEKLQDYSVLELGLRTWDADMLYQTMLSQVSDAKCEVEDNQALVVAFGSKDALAKYQELTKEEVATTIRNAYQEVGVGMDDSEIEKAYEEALQRVTMA